MRTLLFFVLMLLLSVSIGATVFVCTNRQYRISEMQGPYEYLVEFGDGVEAKNLGVVVDVNMSFAKTWFVGNEQVVTLEVSAEKVSGLVQNFSWQIFWIKLFTVEDGEWKEIVAHGSSFLNESERHDAYLCKHQKVPVHVANLNYLESVDKAWFGIEILMSVFHNHTEYSFTFSTPRNEIGPVAVLSPLYSPTSLAAIATSLTAVSTILASQFLGKIVAHRPSVCAA